jgi:DNA-binding transcriptional ArsR family regulator
VSAEPDDIDIANGYDVFSADPDLIRPLSHPTRLRIYSEAVRGPVSAKELAERLEQPIARLSYHVKTLADAGLLRPVRRTQRRGAVETHYRAIATIDIDDETMRSLPEKVQATLFQLPVRAIAEEVDAALDSGAFKDTDLFISRAHLKVPASSRERVQAEVLAMYERLAELERELSEEAKTSGEEVVPLNVVLIQYRGARRSGRNAPFMVMWDRPGEPILETIPDEY